MINVLEGHWARSRRSVSAKMCQHLLVLYQRGRFYKIRSASTAQFRTKLRLSLKKISVPSRNVVPPKIVSWLVEA